MEKYLSEITRAEWIACRWMEIPGSFEDEEDRRFISRGKRTPDEASQAMMEWDSTENELGEF